MLLRSTISAFLLCSCFVPVQAEMSGFASLGVAWFSNPHADFAYDNHSTGPGNSRNIDLALDSNLGLQWSTVTDHQLRLTAQTVVYRDASNHLKPELTLFNALVPVNDRFSLRFGRSQNPNFLYSDYRQVHYALPWIRPPREVYGVTSLFNYDGAQARYQQTMPDDWQLVTLAGMAQVDMNYSLNGGQDVDRAHADSVHYASVSLNKADWTLKLSYETGKLTANAAMVGAAFDGLRQMGYSDLANQMALENKTYQFVGLGVRMDSADWLLVGEVAWRSLDAYFGQRGGAYFTLGKHLGRYMPYLTLARTWTLNDSSSQPLAQSLYDAVSYSASSLSVGVSVTLSSQMVLKTELQGIAPDPGSRWVYEQYDAQYNYRQPGQDVLLSVSLAMVF